MEDLKANKQMYKILLETQLGCIEDDEYNKAFNITLQEITGNKLKKVSLEYILDTLSTKLDLVRRNN